MTPTGRLRPSPSAAADKASALEALGARVHIDVQIPRTQVAAKMRLVSRSEELGIVAETREMLRQRKLPLDAAALASLGMVNEWNCEIAARTLAIAVRDPEDTSRPLASLEEWRECDDDQIGALWEEYQDLRERIDPLKNYEQLSEQELAAMVSAAKKKPPEIDLLMSYGSRKLALFAISTVAPPAT